MAGVWWRGRVCAALVGVLGEVSVSVANEVRVRFESVLGLGLEA